MDRASASEAEGWSLQVNTGKELGRQQNPVAPDVAPEIINADENGQGETNFAAALLMLARLPLSDEERAEVVKRLLKDAGDRSERWGT